MPIGHARAEFVKRVNGKNACAKAAYNSRSRIEFEGNCVMDPEIYDWSSKESPAFHEILLPVGAHEKFKSPEVLWNAVEAKEKRCNSVVAIDFLLALPDDQVISLEDRIHLTRTFFQKHFVDKGLAVQVDIHFPERKIKITRDNQEIGLFNGMVGNIIKSKENLRVVQLDNGRAVSFNPQEFTGFVEKESNWHAHALITTRRFQEDGLDLGEKVRDGDFTPTIVRGKGFSRGKVIAKPAWGKFWTDLQNDFFKEKGLELRVDANGIVPQEHLGPRRMRSRDFPLLGEHHRIEEANLVAASDPEKILEAITKNESVFTEEDVEHFLAKHAPAESIEALCKDFWQQPKLVQLVDKQTGELLSKFTSQKVIKEEQRILRLADCLNDKKSLKIDAKYLEGPSQDLNVEQKRAFLQIARGSKLSLLQGYAGTGKSYLLKAIQTAYEGAGYRVRAFGPDSATSKVLSERGLSHTENVYKFLFCLRHDKREISKGEEIWILDEAGKLGNRPLLEFLKEAEKRDVQVVFSGDAAQLPPVERGGMFKVFCDRYGSQVLEDVQRQKTDKHREIARNLATGDFGAAIDKLCTARSIRWSESKREAIEELIVQWAQDSKTFQKSSNLIIAHSNAEMRVLNDMVHIIRKQRGELGEREFSCATFKGTIFVSVGDRLEFRKNDNDLGVSNGLSGTLIEADPKRFVVSIRTQDNERQTVVFNPQKYHAFQLGYASTYNRSQGRTVDRAYVLHCSRANKEMFYVGLTRHVRDVFYFVSKEEAYCLADLKRLTLKSGEKLLTVNYSTQEAINSQKETEERLARIQDLKGSDALLNKVKGYGLETWQRITSNVLDVKDHIQDRLPDASFYNPVIPKSKVGRFPVQEVVDLAAFSTPDFSEDKPMKPSPGMIDREVYSNSETMNVNSVPLSRKFDKFTPEQQESAKSYFNQADKASALKCVAEAEAEISTREIRFSAHFRQWQQACGLRNCAAYELLQKASSENLREVLDPKVVIIVREQADRHEILLAKKEAVSKPPLYEQLKSYLEPLLYRLYPEGPTSRDRKHFRFGRKGSLSVVHSGAKTGQFFDFKQDMGGGLMKLIQRELGLGRLEARTWAQDFLGVASDISVPKTFSKPVNQSKEESDWISLLPNHNAPVPKLAELKGKKLDFYFTEVSRHAYKDETGQLLYYVLRLKDKEDPERKITPPLSYGYWKNRPEQIGWELKGYRSEKNYLYNLPLLKENPRADVLIVEGEKAADRALNKVPGNYVCITWPGGCHAVQRADWSPLSGRKVWIWPDNDQAGYQAAERICRELRKVGVESLHLVNKDELKKHFPEKWDLADELPKGISDYLPQKLLASSLQKAINPERILHRLSIDLKDLVQRNRVNEILWRVDERLRVSLENKHGVQSKKVEEEITKETTKLILNQEIRREELKEKYGVDGAVLEKLNYQVSIFEAQHGRKLRMGEINAIKAVIQEHGYVQIPKTIDKGVSDLVSDRMLTNVCDCVLNGFSKEESFIPPHKAVTSSVQQAQNEIDHGKQMAVQKQNDPERETGNSIKF